MKVLKAVIFDFDGVISDSELWHWRAFNEILADYNVKLAKGKYYEKYLGFTDAELFQHINVDYNIGLKAETIDELVERKAGVFADMLKAGGHIIDGVKEFLELLRDNKIAIAICSGAAKADIDVMLTGSGLEPFFDVIVTADDVVKGKPDPAGYLLTLEELNELSNKKITAENCVVIEDSHWGIEAAVNAGMAVVAVTNSYPADDLKSADRIVANLRDLQITDLQRLCE